MSTYRLGNEIVTRTIVPSSKSCWKVSWPEYSPVSGYFDFKGAPYADPDIGDKGFNPKFNQLDNGIDRRSHQGDYEIDNNGFPLNPTGRCGIRYRGILGKWGPNHAADPIITRWKRDQNMAKVHNEISKKPILQFVAIQRRDTKQWAIPGGMVDPGEQVSETLKREFMEESLNLNEMTELEKAEIKSKLKSLFAAANALEIYKGVVDDPRNTDNAWMETVAVNFHDESGQVFEHIKLNAGDDAQAVRWVDIDQTVELYANHMKFIRMTADKRSANW